MIKPSPSAACSDPFKFECWDGVFVQFMQEIMRKFEHLDPKPYINVASFTPSVLNMKRNDNLEFPAAMADVAVASLVAGVLRGLEWGCRYDIGCSIILPLASRLMSVSLVGRRAWQCERHLHSHYLCCPSFTYVCDKGLDIVIFTDCPDCPL